MPRICPDPSMVGVFCLHPPKRLRWMSRNVCRGRDASTMAVPSASLCDALECDILRADSEPGLPPPMCPPSILPTHMECAATPIQQVEVQATSQSGGGWDSRRRCRRLRIVVGPEPRRQELHDETDGGTDVRATVRGDASGGTLSTIPGVPPTSAINRTHRRS